MFNSSIIPIWRVTFWAQVVVVAQQAIAADFEVFVPAWFRDAYHAEDEAYFSNFAVFQKIDIVAYEWLYHQQRGHLDIIISWEYVRDELKENGKRMDAGM